MNLRAALSALDPRPGYMVGVSGGADSMALLAALHEAGFANLFVCHFSHGLRPGSSRAEAGLVRRFAERCGAAFLHGRGNPRRFGRGLGKEAAARAQRLEFFKRCAARSGCPRVLLAHHLDDQAETVLLNLCRGAGRAGLAAMLPESVHGSLVVLRPLLEVRRAELRAYVEEKRIAFAEDPSNASLEPTRNKVRHRLLPVLLEVFGPSCPLALARAATLAGAENAWMDALVPPPPVRLQTATLRAMPVAMRRRCVLRWLRERGVPEPGFAETERVLGLLASRTAKVNLPGGGHARRRAGEIFHEPGNRRQPS
jgi:tRNA(Ile)-lysidine synthase